MLTVILSFMLVFSVLLSSSSMVFAEETVLTENIIEQEVSDSLTDDMISDGESDENISDSISETQEIQEVPDSLSDDMISDGESDENFSDGISETLENRINALPIIYKNGTHYIKDPEYPDEIITLFCMNNKLHWPHHTNDMGDMQVPNYTEGYLKPEDFSTMEDYNTCMRRLSNYSMQVIHIMEKGYIRL